MASVSTHLRVGFSLRCFQRFSLRYVATLRILHHKDAKTATPWIPTIFNPPVLKEYPFNAHTITPDIDQTVLRRSEPSSSQIINGRTAQPLGPSTALGYL